MSKWYTACPVHDETTGLIYSAGECYVPFYCADSFTENDTPKISCGTELWKKIRLGHCDGGVYREKQPE